MKSLGGTRFPATQLPEHLDGPLSLVRTKAPTGPMNVKKVHLALTTRITVGCGMSATKCDIITEYEMIPQQATMAETAETIDPRICARCFKFYFWDPPLDPCFLSDCWYDESDSKEPDLSDDSMPSASGDSSNSNDSESEDEALRPPTNPVT